MNNIITNIKSLELETLKNLKNSKSLNTIRAYQSDYNDFSLFCSRMDFNQCLQSLKFWHYILQTYHLNLNIAL